MAELPREYCEEDHKPMYEYVYDVFDSFLDYVSIEYDLDRDDIFELVERESLYETALNHEEELVVRKWMKEFAIHIGFPPACYVKLSDCSSRSDLWIFIREFDASTPLAITFRE